jgi:hypothetical protein
MSWVVVLKDAGLCPVRCHPPSWYVYLTRGEEEWGHPSIGKHSTHPADVQAPTTDLSSPHAPIIALHCLTSRVSLGRQHHYHLEAIREHFYHPHSRRRCRRIWSLRGDWSASPIVSDRCTGRRDPRDSLSSPLSNSSQPNRQRLHLTPETAPSPAPACTPTKPQQRTIPPGQMRSNRAPRTVLQ